MKNPTFLTLILVLMTGWFAGITAVSEAKIIALWTFDEGQGKAVTDKSGNGNDGKVTGGKATGLCAFPMSLPTV